MFKRMRYMLLVCGLMLSVLMSQAFAATSISGTPSTTKVEYGYTTSVRCGTVRYISQISGSAYFYDNYWGSWKSQAGIECGTASISMALSYLGVNTTPKQILDKNDGDTYFDGWNATYQVPSSVSVGMDRYINGNGKYSPVIVHFKTGGNYTNGHYVCLVGVDASGNYLVCDPANSNIWTLKTTSAKYKEIDQIKQYYKASASISDVSTLCTFKGVFSNKSERYTKTEPYSDSTSVSKVQAGQLVTATKLVTNKYGNIWAQLTDGSYIVYYDKNSGERFLDFHSFSEDIAVSGLSAPTGDLEQGDIFNVTGVLKASAPFSSVTATIFDMNSGMVVQSATAHPSISATSVNLNASVNGVNINYKMLFDELPKGSYAFYVEVAHGFEYNGEEFFFAPYRTPVTTYFTVGNPFIPVQFIEVIGEVNTLKYGDAHLFQWKVYPENATNQEVTWTSSNEDVIWLPSSADGVVDVFYEGLGTTTITVEAADGYGASYSFDVTVYDEFIPVERIEVTNMTDQLYYGQPYEFLWKVYPENATNQRVDWSSSNEDVIWMPSGDGSEGSYADVFYEGYGTTYITFTAEDGYGATVSFPVQVYEAFNPVEAIIVTNEVSQLYFNQPYMFESMVYPETAACKDVTWTSSNEDVIWMGSMYGDVFYEGYGTTMITARANDGSGVSYSFFVTVYDPDASVESVVITNKVNQLSMGEPYQFLCDVNPGNAHPGVTWTSSNEDVIWIGSEYGDVFYEGYGTTTIAVCSVADPSVSDSVTVTVLPPLESISIVADSEVVVGENTLGEVVITPADAEYDRCEIINSNPEVIELLVFDEGGTEFCFEPLTAGTATLTANVYYGGYVHSAYLTITVQARKLVTGLSISGIDRTMCLVDVMYATIHAEPADHDCTMWQYYSTNPDVFDVLTSEVFTDDMGRLVVPVESYALGTAELVVRALDGSRTECAHTITVQEAPSGMTIFTTQELPEGSNSTGFFVLEPNSAMFDVCEVLVDDPAIARVTYDSVSGEFIWYAQEPGTTAIRVFAYWGNAVISGSYPITVRERVLVEDIRIRGLSREMYVGETGKMYYVVLPEGHDCTSFQYSSNKPLVADFDLENAYSDPSKGIVIPVKALSAGRTRLTVSAGDGSGETGTYDLTVLAAPESIRISIPREITAGKRVSCSFEVLPEGVTYDSVQIRSSKASVLEIEDIDESTGQFTCVAKTPGYVTVFVEVKYGSLTLKRNVTVDVVEPVYVTSCEIVGLKPVMNVGEVLSFYLTSQPANHENTGWKYDCSNPSAANLSVLDAFWDDSIGDQRIPVTAYAQGVSNITVTAMDGSGTSATWRIVVLDPAKVKKFTLPDNLRIIDAEAFMNVPMEYLVINNGCTTIGAQAFANCSGLLIAEIPASVTSIAANAFNGCSDLTIVAPKGSAAHSYAISQGIPWLENIP